VVEAGVGERPAQALVEEQEPECHLDALSGKLIGIARAIAREQAVPLEFPEIVAELIPAVASGGKLEGGKDGLMHGVGRPAAHGVAAVQQHFQQAEDPGVVELDSGRANGADGEGQSQSLQQRKIHVPVETLGLETGAAIGDRLESFSHGVEMIQPFLQAEVAQVVGAQLVAQIRGELLILLEEGMLPPGAENMVAVLDLINHGGQFAA